MQNVHIKRFPERKSSTKLKIDIQCHLEYMSEIIYALAFPAGIRISKIVRNGSETVRFHWFTYKRKEGDEESDSDSDATLDDDDVANSDGVISGSVSSLLQVGEIAVI